MLGIKLEKVSNGSWLLHQHQFIDEIMRMYSINNEKPVEIPIQPNLGLSIELEDEEETMRLPIDSTKYRQTIGKLMYLMICSRPDLSFSVSLLSRFLHAPKEKHLRCVLRLLKYIKSTKTIRCLIQVLVTLRW